MDEKPLNQLLVVTTLSRRWLRLIQWLVNVLARLTGAVVEVNIEHPYWELANEQPEEPRQDQVR
jgi:hypothetical protein